MASSANIKPVRIAIVAGESSGDLLGAGLITALKQIIPDAVFEGIAGPKMRAAGCINLFDMERLSVMGLMEVLPKLPEILIMRRALTRYLLNNPPDLFIGIDVPDFVLPIEIRLKKQGIKTVHYVSPTIWAWRAGRIKKIARAVNLMLTLFPFEEILYKQHNVPVKFVGHPLADQIPQGSDKITARKKLNLPVDANIIALLPGSRNSELHYLAKLFLQTALYCQQKKTNLHFIMPVVDEQKKQRLMMLQQVMAPHLSLQIIENNSVAAMSAADVILLASGTATLEAMLVNRPMVVAYKMSPLTYAIARRLVKVKQIALPNLLANKPLVPEFIQENATVENLANAVLGYLTQPKQVAELAQAFDELRTLLGHNVSQQAAQAVLELL